MDERQHQPHRRLARRHGHRQEAAGREGVSTSSPTARTGQAGRRADVELFGWRMVQVDGKNEFRIETKTLRRQDRRRRPAPGPHRRPGRPQGILPVARHRADGRGPVRPPRLLATSGRSAATTRPTTRSRSSRSPTGRSIGPGSRCSSSSGSARARYDQPDASDFAGKTFTVEIQNPKGEKVFTKNFTADAFGGFDG